MQTYLLTRIPLEDGFVSWPKGLVDSQENGVLDFVNPKIEKLLIKTALEKLMAKKMMLQICLDGEEILG